MKYARSAAGFTMVEMIGVLAIIAILASVATPRIVQAMRDAKVSAAVQEIGTLRSALSQFYKDTGRFPVHNDRSTNPNQHQLLSDTRTGITGWDGPYIEKSLVNPFDGNRSYQLTASTNNNFRFDFDGNGSIDQTGTVAHLRMDVATADLGRRISDAIDQDGDNATGTQAWYASGRVKTIGARDPGTGVTRLIVYMGDF